MPKMKSQDQHPEKAPHPVVDEEPSAHAKQDGPRREGVPPQAAYTAGMLAGMQRAAGPERARAARTMQRKLGSARLARLMSREVGATAPDESEESAAQSDGRWPPHPVQPTEERVDPGR